MGSVGPMEPKDFKKVWNAPEGNTVLHFCKYFHTRQLRTFGDHQLKFPTTSLPFCIHQNTSFHWVFCHKNQEESNKMGILETYFKFETKIIPKTHHQKFEISLKLQVWKKMIMLFRLFRKVLLIKWIAAIWRWFQCVSNIS